MVGASELDVKFKIMSCCLEQVSSRYSNRTLMILRYLSFFLAGSILSLEEFCIFAFGKNPVDIRVDRSHGMLRCGCIADGDANSVSSSRGRCMHDESLLIQAKANEKEKNEGNSS